MEAQEDVIGYNTTDQTHMIMIKIKRTKRPRPPSPLSLTMASTTSSASTEGGGSTSGLSDNSAGLFSMTAPSPPLESSIEFTKIDREEEDHDQEDMANCLILLAQGGQLGQARQAAVRNKAAGSYVYQCKTCDRPFPSFQALGGHRASHKKPKLITLEEKKSPLVSTSSPKIEDQDDTSNNIIDPTTLLLRISPNKAAPLCSCTNSNPNKTKVHECSICGAEFTSGQALGGHMRRHRAMPAAAIVTTSSTIHTISESCQEVIKKPTARTLLSLDLNLPAPPEDHHDHRESKFPFRSKEQIIVFSASSLVDCHF